MKLKQYLKSTTAVTLATLISIVLIFMIQVLLARLLEPAKFGDFIALIAVVTVFSTFSSFGADLALLKKYGNSKSDGNNFGYKALRFTVASSVCSAFLMLIFSLITVPDKIIYYLILLPCVISYAFWNLSNIVLQVQGKFLKLAMFQMSQAGIRFFLLLLCYAISGLFLFDLFFLIHLLYLYVFYHKM